MLALIIDADGSRQYEVLFDVDVVDLDDQQVQLGQIGRHPFRHALCQQRHEPARYRRLGQTRTLGRRHITCR